MSIVVCPNAKGLQSGADTYLSAQLRHGTISASKLAAIEASNLCVNVKDFDKLSAEQKLFAKVDLNAEKKKEFCSASEKKNAISNMVCGDLSTYDSRVSKADVEPIIGLFDRLNDEVNNALIAVSNYVG